jgi:hypothetical protein
VKGAYGKIVDHGAGSACSSHVAGDMCPSARSLTLHNGHGV